MRQVGQLTSERDARLFVAWLTTQRIDASAEQESAGWSVWVRDEDNLPAARAALEEFNRNPADPRYVAAEKEATAILREELEKRERARKNQVQMRDQWAGPGPSARRCPVTFALIGLSVAVAIVGTLGGSTGVSLRRALMFSDPGAAEVAARAGEAPQLLRTGAEAPSEREVLNYVTWFSIRHGEIWRLFTPAILHGNVIHLLFNMMMLYSFGTRIEARYGSWIMALLAAVLAVLSNSAQAYASGPAFLGMSGVVYGLFGFMWMRATLDPNSRLTLDQGTVFILMIWFVVCLATEIPGFELGGMMGRVANYAHGAGLIAGIILGIPWLRYLKGQQAANQ